MYPRPNVGYSYYLNVPTKLCCVTLTILYQTEYSIMIHIIFVQYHGYQDSEIFYISLTPDCILLFLNKYKLQTLKFHFEIEIFTNVYKCQHVRLNNFKGLRPFNNHSELYLSYN